MPVDPRWRAKIEAAELAGFDYLLADRVRQAREALLEAPRPSAMPARPAPQPEAGDSNPKASMAAPDRSQNAGAAANAQENVGKADNIEANPARLIELKTLAAEVSECRKCSVLCAARTQTVFADGDPHAELCFVGEAPGADEDATGVPFVGKAGQLLTKIIEACKLRRDEVYICNVLKCRPPGNRNPMPDEVENCRHYLDRQLQLVRPKLMVALGKFATAYLLNEPPERVPITRLRGQIREYCGIPFMITLHPAYLLRNPPAKADVWEDMKTVMRMLGKPVG